MQSYCGTVIQHHPRLFLGVALPNLALDRSRGTPLRFKTSFLELFPGSLHSPPYHLLTPPETLVKASVVKFPTIRPEHHPPQVSTPIWNSSLGWFWKGERCLGNFLGSSFLRNYFRLKILRRLG